MSAWNWWRSWRSMQDAPRDGTVVELRCTYGVVPYTGLYRWTPGVPGDPWPFYWRAADSEYLTGLDPDYVTDAHLQWRKP